MTANLILVSNGAPELVEPLRANLKRLGYELHSLQTSDEALIFAGANSLTAFFVAIANPEYDGIEVCRRLKCAASQIPLVALNLTNSTLMAAALSAGADVVMDQPLDWTAVSQWLANPHSDDQIGTVSISHRLLGDTPDEVRGAAALLSHDLRSPISTVVSSLEAVVSIFGMSEVMQNEYADMMQLLHGALDAAYRQLYIVSDLVDLARLETGEFDLRLSKTDLTLLLRKALTSQKPLLEAKFVRIETTLPDAGCLLAICDSALVERAFIALLDNVVKFTMRGDHLHVSAQADSSMILIRFTDSGRAIVPGLEEQIVLRAPHWEGRQKGSRTSVAMGIPFVYWVARAHAGEFTARSEESTGLTTFSFMLPSLDTNSN
ncbi:MAG: hybrid sensor histidine kinase/response regulator [Burkholderiales bacterium]|nr:hybrid sensor histidine kinase/response regulator [Anaerolineae bacterium]